MAHERSKYRFIRRLNNYVDTDREIFTRLKRVGKLKGEIGGIKDDFNYCN